MSAADITRGLVLLLRGSDVAMAEDAAATLRAMGWTAARIRKARKA